MTSCHRAGNEVSYFVRHQRTLKTKDCSLIDLELHKAAERTVRQDLTTQYSYPELWDRDFRGFQSQ
jgi:hypothetical protein